MNSTQECSGADMFPTEKEGGRTPLTIELRGITVEYTDRVTKQPRILKGVPSFKTGKTAFAWRDKVSGKIMARPLTLPEHKKWMEKATLAIECQLRSFFQITDAKIRMVASPRSWIASLVPLDDCWTWCPETNVKCELCEPGQEGARIVIERI